MKTYLKMMTLIIAIGLIAALAACGGNPPQAVEEDSGEMVEEEMVDAGSIWVLLPDSASSARWETDDRRFFEQAFDAAGVEYNIVNAEGDASTQQTQAEQAITAGAKVILMVNLDSGSAAAIIENAHAAGVKVVDYDRLTVEGPGADVYVSFDNVSVGATMGTTLEPLINAQDDPQIAFLNGGPTDNNATLFRDGYAGVAQPYLDSGDWTLVDDQWVPGWDNQEALVVFEQMLTAADNNITAVFAANDGLAGAVIQALANAGIDPATVPVSGQDATVGGLQQVLAGNQSMSVYKPIKAEAETAAAAAIALLNGDSLDALTGGNTLNNGTNDVPFIALDVIGVTKDNVAETVIADGFRTWAEICVGDFAQYCPEDQGGMAVTEEMADGSDLEGSIWVLLPDSASSARWETDDRRFFEEAFEAAGVEYNIVNAEGDPSTQQTQAEQAITAGAKVILMVNLDSGSGAAIIENARAAGVKVIDYDRLTVEGPGADIYVSFDNVRVGATMGEALEPLIDAQDDPQVAFLNGGPTDNNATLFRDGYLGIAQSHFDDASWTLVDDQWVPGWDNQEALVVFEQMLTAADNNITAVFAANDGLAGAVIQALANAGIDPTTVPVSGQDATVGGLQQVLAGNQSMSVYKPIKGEAFAAANAAIALLNGDDLEALTGGLTLNNGTNEIPFLALDPIGVTVDNIAETVIADGFRTWEEICVGDFAQFCPSADGAMIDLGSSVMDGSAVEGSIWVLLPDSASSARWETDDRRFFEEAFEAAGVEYNIVNAEGDASTQQTQAEQAITAGASVILIVNLDSGSGAAIIENAHAAGVKVIDYDRLTIEGAGADAYVSFDNVQVGATMADVLVPIIDAQDSPKVVYLNGGPTDNNATLFRDGYSGAAQPFIDSGAWELVDDQWVPGWDNQEALVVFEQILTAANNEVTAVFAANDGLAGAVIQALDNAGIDPTTVPVSGQDATVGGLQQVLAGNQTMSVYKPIKAEAYAAANVAIALASGMDMEELTGGLTLNNGTNDVPFVALAPIGVTASNVAETVIADGFRTWDEICVGDFEQYCPADR
ncbi:MAG: D-xylose transport system substrate-binding protein [Cellvibrionaceae bacterium]|jgi:D-xylose transport system substrate-binding protein